MIAKLPPRPIVHDAPGCTWMPSGYGWEARWRPRTDLVRKGYPGQTSRLWKGTELTDKDRGWISESCNRLQTDMLGWARGAKIEVSTFDGTLRTLVDQYQTDTDSPYKKLRYRTRLNYDGLLKRIVADYGHVRLGGGFDAEGNPTEPLRARKLLRWHEEWSKRGVTTSHGLMTMLRMVLKFGATFLEDDECKRLCPIIKGLPFANGGARTERLTAEQASAVRAEAHRHGFHAMALAQALQFEGTLRQRDVIGEWVPVNEPGTSEVLRDEDKWLRGLRWSSIDQNMVLRHVTSKRNKLVEVNLMLAPMVLDELALLLGEPVRRELLPASGPVIVDEYTGLPYTAGRFRREWRRLATAAGIPSTVCNMDSRAGAISEATDSGAQLEDVRHAATHSNIATTQRYSRSAAEKTAKVMVMRAASRKKQT